MVNKKACRQGRGPVSVEVVTVMPVMLSNCPSCTLVFHESGVEKEVNKEILGEYPVEMRESLDKLSDAIRQLADIYGEQINISFINAQSFAGIYRSLVHRTRTYPAFIIGKTDVYTGLELPEIRKIIDSYLEK
ncbi:MAG TPA: hypothetical protein PKK79_03545 [Syntrophorhabdaceae bacterium]|nr:hypothetical protein [Syntrophorhabdaceae bacterium]